jgi:hypothetical protein
MSQEGIQSAIQGLFDRLEFQVDPEAEEVDVTRGASGGNLVQDVEDARLGQAIDFGVAHGSK